MNRLQRDVVGIRQKITVVERNLTASNKAVKLMEEDLSWLNDDFDDRDVVENLDNAWKKITLELEDLRSIWKAMVCLVI